MNTTWHTKWGARRVRKDPPTIEEALIAAESMTDDLDQRVEIAASLIGAPVEEVKALAAKQAHLSRGRSTLVTGRNRAVVVEYKRPRTIRPPGAARRSSRRLATTSTPSDCGRSLRSTSAATTFAAAG